MRVLTLSNADIHATLSPAACEQAMAAVLAARARGDAFNPLRTVTIPPGAAGFIGLMPSYASALARDGARVLGLLGAGVQARSHLAALADVRPWDEVRVYAPTTAHVEALR